MNWWRNDNTVLVIGMAALCLGIVIGRFVPDNSYSPLIEIVLYALSLFFNGTYLGRFLRHTRTTQQSKGMTND
ncbi:MAG: hypothetical protein L0Y55_19550, partial [Anaerolineales bacterium]|nr:hypothetical protein [Anaerolineales bacterium]